MLKNNKIYEGVIVQLTCNFFLMAARNSSRDLVIRPRALFLSLSSLLRQQRDFVDSMAIEQQLHLKFYIKDFCCAIDR